MKYTDQQIAQSLQRLLTETKVSIPFGMAGIAVVIQGWLNDIAEGRCVVVEVKAAQLSGGSDEGDFKGGNGSVSDLGAPLDSNPDS